MSKEKTNSLLNCPFCGVSLKKIGSKRRGNQFYVHDLNGPDCILKEFAFKADDEEKIKRWNTRKPMKRIVERLEETKTKSYVTGITANPYEFGACHAMNDAIAIVKEEGGLNEE